MKKIIYILMFVLSTINSQGQKTSNGIHWTGYINHLTKDIFEINIKIIIDTNWMMLSVFQNEKDSDQLMYTKFNLENNKHFLKIGNWIEYPKANLRRDLYGYKDDIMIHKTTIYKQKIKLTSTQKFNYTFKIYYQPVLCESESNPKAYSFLVPREIECKLEYNLRNDMKIKLIELTE